MILEDVADFDLVMLFMARSRLNLSNMGMYSFCQGAYHCIIKFGIRFESYYCLKLDNKHKNKMYGKS